ncbi:MAG: transposase-like protein [Cyclobacteriaceae bacterium]|jgi:transposase-like protein
MEKESIKSYFTGLSANEREALLEELQQLGESDIQTPKCQEVRRAILDNKQGCCAHCGHAKYVKFGKDKGAHRYKCKSCKRSFTEYSGTWMDGLHRKDKIDAYLKLMLEEKTLDKITETMGINKKTAFDWRHKILSAIEQSEKSGFTGITESDETFFLHSEKGKKQQDKKPRKRGGKSTKRGVNDEHIAVIVTQDRKDQIDLTVAATGRIKKIDIANAIGERLTRQTVLCTDSHGSYKGFAIDREIEHHALRANQKQRVKHGVYHIQHVNSTHNRLKKWIDNKFWGVSTKYLQQYLNWFRIKETLKGSKQFLNDFAQISAQDVKAYKRYASLSDRYEMVISTQT